MSVLDRSRLPWLRAEEDLITKAVSGGKPYWGVCLGAQLLASSLDAAVYRGPRPEVGMTAIELCSSTSRDHVFVGLPASFSALEWHEDSFELPDGAVLLAHSAAYRHQAFRWGVHAYGLQFHLELSLNHVSQWKRHPGFNPLLGDLELGPPELLAGVRANQTRMRHLSRTLFRRWLEML